MAEQTSTQDTQRLMTAALRVWNRALAEHRDQTPYRQILAGCHNVFGDEPLGIDVYDNDPEQPLGHFTVRFNVDRFEYIDVPNSDETHRWKVSRSFLKDVAQRADHYVEHPAEMNWNWLTSRVLGDD